MFTLIVKKFKWDNHKGFILVSESNIAYESRNDLLEQLKCISYAGLHKVNVEIRYSER